MYIHVKGICNLIFKVKDIALLGSHHYRGPEGDYKLGAFLCAYPSATAKPARSSPEN